MSDALVPFAFDGCAVRVHIDEHGEPWFVAVDVARVLGYANPQKAVRDHCKGVNEARTPSPGGVQATNVIPERDVYRLIMRSHLPEAERFEEWVVGEVLPQIRKTGSYGAPDPLAALADPAQLRTLLLGYTEKVIALEAANAELAPKAEVYDAVIDAGETVGFREAAKILRRSTGVTERELAATIIGRGWAQRLGKKLAPAYYGEAHGYVTSRLSEWKDLDGIAHAKPEFRITPKGLARLAEIFAPEAAA